MGAKWRVWSVEWGLRNVFNSQLSSHDCQTVNVNIIKKILQIYAFYGNRINNKHIVVLLLSKQLSTGWMNERTNE